MDNQGIRKKVGGVGGRLTIFIDFAVFLQGRQIDALDLDVFTPDLRGDSGQQGATEVIRGLRDTQAAMSRLTGISNTCGNRLQEKKKSILHVFLACSTSHKLH